MGTKSLTRWNVVDIKLRVRRDAVVHMMTDYTWAYSKIISHAMPAIWIRNWGRYCPPQRTKTNQDARHERGRHEHVQNEMKSGQTHRSTQKIAIKKWRCALHQITSFEDFNMWLPNVITDTTYYRRWHLLFEMRLPNHGTKRYFEHPLEISSWKRNSLLLHILSKHAAVLKNKTDV